MRTLLSSAIWPSRCHIASKPSPSKTLLTSTRPSSLTSCSPFVRRPIVIIIPTAVGLLILLLVINFLSIDTYEKRLQLSSGDSGSSLPSITVDSPTPSNSSPSLTVATDASNLPSISVSGSSDAAPTPLPTCAFSLLHPLAHSPPCDAHVTQVAARTATTNAERAAVGAAVDIAGSLHSLW